MKSARNLVVRQTEFYMQSNRCTWNVRPLYQSGKLSQVINSINQYQIDILGVAETRWTGDGKLRSGGSLVLYSGKELEHTSGVAIIVIGKADKGLLSWTPHSDKIITARFLTAHGNHHVLCPNKCDFR